MPNGINSHQPATCILSRSLLKSCQRPPSLYSRCPLNKTKFHIRTHLANYEAQLFFASPTFIQDASRENSDLAARVLMTINPPQSFRVVSNGQPLHRAEPVRR